MKPLHDVVFVGLGKMGAPMARHLAAAGFRVRGVEPSAARRAALEIPAVTVLSDLADVWSDPPDVVISSLPDDVALLDVSEVLATSAPPGTVWIDTSTVSPAASAVAASRCGDAGLTHVRAAVSGNAPMAEAARLTVLASGDPDLYARCEPIFACWGEQRLHVGTGEEARACKLAVNLMVVGLTALLAEALVLGQRAGVAREELLRVLEASAIASPLLRAKLPALRAHDYTSTFSVSQMRKDLSLMRDAADTLGIDLPITALAAAAMEEAERSGAAKLDYAVIVRDAERSAGLSTAPAADGATAA